MVRFSLAGVFRFQIPATSPPWLPSSYLLQSIFLPENISAKVGFGLRSWHLLVLIFLPVNIFAMSGFPFLCQFHLSARFQPHFTGLFPLKIFLKLF